MQPVRAALTAPDPEHRRVALGAAHRLGILDVDALIAAFGDPAPQVRRRAAELAARLTGSDPDAPGRAELSDALVELLADAECAEVAAFALGELPVSRPDVVEALGRQAVGHTDPLAREAAVAALGSLGADRETVLAALADVATVRRRAVIALANFDGDEVELALQRATEDRDWQVRQAAEDLLAPPPGPDS